MKILSVLKNKNSLRFYQAHKENFLRISKLEKFENILIKIRVYTLL